jgi:UDP-4-amino-4-deoxy-L-arabinose-oxoglutarate aminotransferase
VKRSNEPLNRLPVRPDYLAFGRPDFSEEEIAAVAAVMRSGWVGMGPETIAFERELAQYVGSPQMVSVSSCTAALFLSLAALGIGPGDEVICPSLTWCSTANAAIYLGARPVFCDVDRDTLCVTPETILEYLTPRTKAVMVVHMGGLAAEVAALRAALPASVAIVEDAAHALGARFADGLPVGASGNLTCFSFYANKNLSTAEGGAVAAFDAAHAARIGSLRQHGLSTDAWKRYSQPYTALVPGIAELGYKMNLTDLQSAIGRVQLRRQPEFAERRLGLALRYRALLENDALGLDFQTGAFGQNHARHLLVVRLPLEHINISRDELVLALRACNIGASIHYSPLHAMPYYAERYAAKLPNTEYLASRIMTLPISASMTGTDVDYVVAHLRELLG